VITGRSRLHPCLGSFRLVAHRSISRPASASRGARVREGLECASSSSPGLLNWYGTIAEVWHQGVLGPNRGPIFPPDWSRRGWAEKLVRWKSLFTTDSYEFHPTNSGERETMRSSLFWGQPQSLRWRDQPLSNLRDCLSAFGEAKCSRFGMLRCPSTSSSPTTTPLYHDPRLTLFS